MGVFRRSPRCTLGIQMRKALLRTLVCLLAKVNATPLADCCPGSPQSPPCQSCRFGDPTLNPETHTLKPEGPQLRNLAHRMVRRARAPEKESALATSCRRAEDSCDRLRVWQPNQHKVHLSLCYRALSLGQSYSPVHLALAGSRDGSERCADNCSHT